jgi:hypothetical protein
MPEDVTVIVSLRDIITFLDENRHPKWARYFWGTFIRYDPATDTMYSIPVLKMNYYIGILSPDTWIGIPPTTLILNPDHIASIQMVPPLP